MLGAILAGLFFVLNPGPSSPAPAPPPGELGPEEAAEYESRYDACAGTWNPDQCRADLYEEYFG